MFGSRCIACYKSFPQESGLHLVDLKFCILDLHFIMKIAGSSFGTHIAGTTRGGNRIRNSFACKVAIGDENSFHPHIFSEYRDLKISRLIEWLGLVEAIYLLSIS